MPPALLSFSTLVWLMEPQKTPSIPLCGVLNFMMKVLKVGVLAVGHESLVLREKLSLHHTPPDFGLLYWGGVFGETISLPLLPVSMWRFNLLFWSATFQALFRGNCSGCSYRFATSLGGSEFRTSSPWTALSHLTLL